MSPPHPDPTHHASAGPSASPARRPRFRRAVPNPFRLTDGDLEMLSCIATYRFLTSVHIAALVGRSRDRCNDRLRRLFDAGLCERLRASLWRTSDLGFEPIVYALSPAGAERVAARGFRLQRPAARRPYLEHALAIASFAAPLAAAVRTAGLEFVGPQALAETLPSPLESSAAFTLGASPHRRVVPDLAFALRYADGSQRCYLFELDRGTMPLRRRATDQTSLMAKLETYAAAHAAGEPLRRFGWRAFRILIVTPSARRTKLLRELVRDGGVANLETSGLFWFATAAEISTGPTHAGFCDCRGQLRPLW